jgi:hypothetical protein
LLLITTHKNRYNATNMLTKDDLKLFDELIKKNFETERVHTATLINNAKEELREEIKASEERLTNEIEVSRADAKSDALRILGKLDKQADRIEDLEKATGTPNQHKN